MEARERLKLLRKEKNWSQLTLSGMAGYESATIVAKLETGKAEFTENLAKTFGRVLGVDYKIFLVEHVQ